MNTKFGEWLFQWRIAQGLSVRACGALFNVSGSYISALETGRNVVSKSFLDTMISKYPKLEQDTKLNKFFQEDVNAHKQLKHNRIELVVWARALATIQDKKQADSIRKALEQNGIHVPKQKPKSP
ncbi:MAG: helix-turn-helix domain-containing protein [Brevinema sp.]